MHSRCNRGRGISTREAPDQSRGTCPPGCAGSAWSSAQEWGAGAERGRGCHHGLGKTGWHEFKVAAKDVMRRDWG